MIGEVKRSGARRWAALGTCLFFLGAILSAQAHLGQALHGRCSDHGEVIHLRGDVPPPGAQPGAGAGTLHRARHIQGAHGCLALSFLSTTWDRCASAPSPGQIAASPLTVPMMALAPPGSGALFKLAPKQSPPAA